MKLRASPRHSSFVRNDKISFYQTNEAEAIVHEAVNKDRQNLESLFQETRNRLYRIKSPSV